MRGYLIHGFLMLGVNVQKPSLHTLVFSCFRKVLVYLVVFGRNYRINRV